MKPADDLLNELETLFSDVAVPEPTVNLEDPASSSLEKPPRPKVTPQEALQTPVSPAPATQDSPVEKVEEKLAQELWTDLAEQRQSDQSAQSQALEQQVAALQRRAIHLEASTAVSQAAVSVLDPQELMQTTVNVIRDRFHLYHVSLFLLDETGEWAMVRASTGKAGQQTVAPRMGHRLAVGGENMVGWVCAHRQARIALDVDADAGSPIRAGVAQDSDDPLLPDTRSQMVLPLHTGDRLLGALDVQSTEEAAFDDEDVRTIQGMADTVAIALENAHLFAETRRSMRRQHLAARITDRLQHTTSVADILAKTVQDLGETFDLSEATICLGTETELQAQGNGRNRKSSLNRRPNVAFQDTE